MQIKVVQPDRFAWLIISYEQAKALLNTDTEMYVIDNEDKEWKLDSEHHIDDAKRDNLKIGIELGFTQYDKIEFHDEEFDPIGDIALTELQLLMNTGASFDDEKIAFGILKETLINLTIKQLLS